MNFGEKIKEIRNKRKFGLNQLAIKSGVSASQISRIENGKRQPKVETLRKLAKGLNIPTDEMFKMAGIEVGNPEFTPSRVLGMNDSKLSKDVTEDEGFDIAKALANDDYMLNDGRKLTQNEKDAIKAILRINHD